MITAKISKLSLSLLCAAALVTGCSTSSDTKPADADGSDANSTGQSGSSVTGSNSGQDGLATVFYFDLDQSTLRTDARSALAAHAQNLIANPTNIKLHGHGDERGSREYNMALGERRALAVREFLVLNGVNGSLVEVISFGEEEPAAYGQSEEAYKQNRRVEMK